MTTRLHASNNVAHQTRTVNGRTYTAVPGTPIDVPDQDARALISNGFREPLGSLTVASVGTTAQRPTMGIDNARDINTNYIDTTLGVVIFWDGRAWRNIITGAVV